MEAVLSWVSNYGPGALFVLLMLGIVGLPIPDETLLVFSGYLISKGKLDLSETVIAAVGGSWCGITASYGIGRTLGLGAVHRFGKYMHLDERRLEQVHAWFDRRGHWALFLGYYIAGVRHFTAIIAGTSKLEFRTFMLYAWSGGLIWACSFLSLGYLVGENWRHILDNVHYYLLWLSAILIVGAIIYAIWRSRSGKNPSAGSPRT